MEIEELDLWMQNVLPTDYDDSLSYLEVLGKVMSKINELIDADLAQSTALEGKAPLIHTHGEYVTNPAVLLMLADYTDTATLGLLLGDKVDKVDGYSLVSNDLIADLSNGGNSDAHTHKAIVNEVSTDNAKVEALATGVKITRNVNDSNRALIVNKQMGNGNIADFQFGGIVKAEISIDGAYTGLAFYGDLVNKVGTNNARLYG